MMGGGDTLLSQKRAAEKSRSCTSLRKARHSAKGRKDASSPLWSLPLFSSARHTLFFNLTISSVLVNDHSKFGLQRVGEALFTIS